MDKRSMEQLDYGLTLAIIAFLALRVVTNSYIRYLR